MRWSIVGKDSNIILVPSGKYREEKKGDGKGIVIKKEKKVYITALKARKM